ILRLAKRYYADAQICHRLDKDTSGVLLIAKNPETYRLVSIEFEKRRVNKIYHAIIQGTHVFNDLKVDLPILNQGNKNVSIERATDNAAETKFNDSHNFKRYTLMESKPITGLMLPIRRNWPTRHAAFV